MRNITRSFGRFSWALSLFGLGGLADFIGRRQNPGRGATAAAVFDSATGALEQDLPGLFRMAFRMGDRVFGSVLDLVLADSTSPLPPRRCQNCTSEPAVPFGGQDGPAGHAYAPPPDPFSGLSGVPPGQNAAPRSPFAVPPPSGQHAEGAEDLRMPSEGVPWPRPTAASPEAWQNPFAYPSREGQGR